jgi:hypothetical protein
LLTTTSILTLFQSNKLINSPALNNNQLSEAAPLLDRHWKQDNLYFRFTERGEIDVRVRTAAGVSFTTLW